MADLSVASIQLQERIDALKLRREERAAGALAVAQSIQARRAEFQERIDRQAEANQLRLEAETERRDHLEQVRNQILQNDLRRLADLDLQAAVRALNAAEPGAPRGSVVDLIA